MENPAHEIEGVIRSLTQGTPEQQEVTLRDYFLADASFSHPFCHVPSFQSGIIPLAHTIDSRWIIWSIYRWYRTLSPHIDLSIDSVAFDQPNGTLYVNIRQTFAVWFIPLYRAPVRLVTVLKLEQRPSWSSVAAETVRVEGPHGIKPKYYISSQEDLYSLRDCAQFLMPRLGPFIWLVWQLFSTGMCVLGSLLSLPIYLLLNNRPTKQVD